MVIYCNSSVACCDVARQNHILLASMLYGFG